jgi:hypothetical protein
MSFNNADLARAFPEELREDALRVASALPQPDYALGAFTVVVKSQPVAIPYRIYHTPPLVLPLLFTIRQRQIFDCLFTRHSDGHTRHYHLRHIISSAELWVAPFVVQLVGEYVIEILHVIRENLGNLDSAVYREFLQSNPAFYALTKQRVISYWDCYHRSQRKADYPGFQIIEFLEGLLTPNPR